MLKQIQAPDRVFGAAKNSALNLFGLYVLEPDLGRLPKAHSDRKGTMGIEKTNLEPGLGRFCETMETKTRFPCWCKR